MSASRETSELDSKWFDLEAAIASYLPAVRHEYGAQLYGGCLEPGYQAQSEYWTIKCPECSRWRCETRTWEAAEGGSLNTYQSESCDACGYYDTDWSEP